MKAQIVKNSLVIETKVETPVASASGKTLVVASSHGNTETEVEVDGKKLIVGLNAYITAKDKKFEKTGDKTAKIKDGTLIITLPMQKPEPSASGKSLVVASTRGNVITDAEVEGKNVVVGVNAYIPAK